MTMSPALLMVLVRSAFRLGQNFMDMRDEAVRAADALIPQLPVGLVDDENVALGYYIDRPQLAANFPGVFDTSRGVGQLLRGSQVDREEKARAIEFALEKLEPPFDLPPWANGKLSSVLAVRGLRTEEAKRRQWSRFGLTLVETGLQVVAAQPSLVSFNNQRAETLIGAFASKVNEIIGPDGIRPGDVNGITFKERAASTLLRASLTAISENPQTIVSAPHWAEFVGSVLSPLAAAQEEEGGRLISLNRLPRLMRGPMAQAALRTLHERQGDFFGERLSTDRAAGAITSEILAAAVRVPGEQFDILSAFSQRGLTLVYTASLNAAATRPDLFIQGDDDSARSFRMLLSNVAGVLRDAPPPYDSASGLADKLTCAVIEVAAAHLTQSVIAKYGNADDPWDLVTRRILTSIVMGFTNALPQALRTKSTSPFSAVFNQGQAIEIVRLIAAQAAQTPHMLLGDGHKNEVYNIAQAIATFMANPNTQLASAADWRAVIAVALEEGAKNPGALFKLEPDAPPESHLAVSLVGVLLNNAAAAVRDVPGVGATPRRKGSVLFGDTLRQAIEMTFRAAANNASALLDPRALNQFVADLQQYVQSQNGALGAAEWLWLYRSFVAEVIANGDARISTEQMTAMVGRIPGMTIVPPPPAPVDEAPTPTEEEGPTS